MNQGHFKDPLCYLSLGGTVVLVTSVPYGRGGELESLFFKKIIFCHWIQWKLFRKNSIIFDTNILVIICAAKYIFPETTIVNIFGTVWIAWTSCTVDRDRVSSTLLPREVNIDFMTTKLQLIWERNSFEQNIQVGQ